MFFSDMTFWEVTGLSLDIWLNSALWAVAILGVSFGFALLFK